MMERELAEDGDVDGALLLQDVMGMSGGAAGLSTMVEDDDVMFYDEDDKMDIADEVFE